jgi:hypothetical protein
MDLLLLLLLPAFLSLWLWLLLLHALLSQHCGPLLLLLLHCQ